jgi:deoxycytidylate deaminase
MLNALGVCVIVSINSMWRCMMREYIITNCITTAGSGLQPCIKQSVYAMLVTLEGKEYFGANWMTNDTTTVCPRVMNKSKTGEDYHYCKEVCNQEFHAEVAVLQACMLNLDSPVGATLYLTGHTLCCDNCLLAMKTANITAAVLLDTNTTYTFTTKEV